MTYKYGFRKLDMKILYIKIVNTLHLYKAITYSFQSAEFPNIIDIYVYIFSFDCLFAFIADIGLEQAQCATRELNLKSV